MQTSNPIQHEHPPETQAQKTGPSQTILQIVPETPSAYRAAMDCLNSCQLTPAAFALGKFMAHHARYATVDDRRRKVEPGEVFVYWSQKKLAAKRNKSISQVKRHIRALRAAGLEVRQRVMPYGASYVFAPTLAPAKNFQPTKETRSATGKGPTIVNPTCPPSMKHAWCDGRVHVPLSLHQQFQRLSPEGFDLPAWYGETNLAWVGKAIGDDSFTFWRARWREANGTTVESREQARRRKNDEVLELVPFIQDLGPETVGSGMTPDCKARKGLEFLDHDATSGATSDATSDATSGATSDATSHREKIIPNKHLNGSVKRELRKDGGEEQAENLRALSNLFKQHFKPKIKVDNPIPPGEGQPKPSPVAIGQAADLKARIEALKHGATAGQV